MKIILFLNSFFCASLFFFTYAAKKEKKKKWEDKRPNHIEPELYCGACQTLVRQALRRLKDSHSEIEIGEFLSKSCHIVNIARSEFPPNDIIKGCEAFIGGWLDEVEEELINRKNNEEVEKAICFRVTRACPFDQYQPQTGKNEDYIIPAHIMYKLKKDHEKHEKEERKKKGDDYDEELKKRKRKKPLTEEEIRNSFTDVPDNEKIKLEDWNEEIELKDIKDQIRVSDL